jgi:hypothetical protein
MKKLTSCCVAAIAGCCGFGAAACENPTMVSLPDGQTATMEQLLTAQGEVKTYMAAMEVYLACVDGELEAKGEDAPAEFKALMVTRHNAAVTEMETIAAAFNEQVKAYKAANPAPASN